jgi:signal transduction histidine kinase
MSKKGGDVALVRALEFLFFKPLSHQFTSPMVTMDPYLEAKKKNPAIQIDAKDFLKIPTMPLEAGSLVVADIFSVFCMQPKDFWPSETLFG